MADNKKQRVCVKFCFLLGKSAAETVLMMQEAFKEEALSKIQVYEWYSHFKGGEMSCEDQLRSGRPSTYPNDVNLEKIRNAINADWRRTTDEISEITGLSWSSCQRMLMEDLNVKLVSAKFVPRLLTEDQKNNCLNVCYDLREQVGNDPQILSEVVTGDRLGATVTTRKQNKHRANGKLPILQNQRRPDRFGQMLRSCWLVFFYANGIV